MTAPAEWRTLPLRRWPERERLFSSWLLLFGLVPIDRHTIHEFRFDEWTGFVEVSSSWMSGCSEDTLEHSLRVAAPTNKPAPKVLRRHESDPTGPAATAEA